MINKILSIYIGLGVMSDVVFEYHIKRKEHFKAFIFYPIRYVKYKLKRWESKDNES